MTAAGPQELARAIEIWSEHPIAVEITWLTVDVAGKETVTARRRTAVGPPVPLEFVHAADRYVRFSYEGASPRTYSTGELLTAERLHVPDVLPGGELLLHVPPMTVRPVQLLVDGPRVHVLTLDNAHASLAGVPPGEYRVTPVYEGGPKSAVRTVTVRAAATTLAHFPPEDVGAARITAAPEVCDSATEVTMDAFVMPNADPKFKVSPGRVRILATREPRCDMTVAGLRPGRFEVFFRRDGTSAGSSLFDASAQTVTPVEVAGPRVTIEGRVTLNGKPLAGASLSFVLRPGQGQRPQNAPASVKTDAQGFYRAGLQVPGTYTAALMRARIAPGETRVVTLIEGRNFQDIALSGGTIRIEVTGRAPGTAVQVRVQSSSAPGTSRMSVFTGDGPLPPHEALAFGTYTVSVGRVPVGRGGRGSAAMPPPETKTVVLSASDPDVTVTFNLNR